ncbi:hypothetical protein CSUI_001191 [Cystoisospora suis]|uniref:Uncharacterized protein n=1 Tax=Cystoisospora suis TaxID=483139 RepID=A0A2C6L9M9_9APIC|nr:hypothetical protein CSUI_001191 [Cystoisospora suis]
MPFVNVQSIKRSLGFSFRAIFKCGRLGVFGRVPFHFKKGGGWSSAFTSHFGWARRRYTHRLQLVPRTDAFPRSLLLLWSMPGAAVTCTRTERPRRCFFSYNQTRGLRCCRGYPSVRDKRLHRSLLRGCSCNAGDHWRKRGAGFTAAVSRSAS